MVEDRLKQREAELAERELDLLQRELNVMILQQQVKFQILTIGGAKQTKLFMRVIMGLSRIQVED